MKRYDNPQDNYVLIKELGQSTFDTIKKVMFKLRRVKSCNENNK